MQNITETRKERIMKERARNAKAQRRKIIGCAIAGTVATSAMFNIQTNKGFANSNKSYVVHKGDTLSELAKQFKVSVEQIKQANHLSSDLIWEGQKIGIPSIVKTQSVSQSMIKRNTNQVYTVVAGDTLSEIALKYGVSIEEIRKANGIRSDLIKVAQKIEIPTPAKILQQKKQSTPQKVSNRVYTVKKGDSLSSIAKKYGVNSQQIKKENGLTTDLIIVGDQLEIPIVAINTVKKQSLKNVNQKVTQGIYTVAPGETIWSIASQFNMTIDKLKAYNHLSDNAVLIGQKLVIKQTNLVKTVATVKGAADQFSVEFIMNGEPIVLQVAYGTAGIFENISEQQVELVYYNAKRPTLISYDYIN